MLSCALSLLLVVVADGDRSLRVKQMFEAYKERFGHDFGDDDDYRMAVFEDNLRYIEEENSKGERRVHYDVNIMLMIVLDSNDYMSWRSTRHLRPVLHP
ncbi:hypothetical protein FOZ62_005198 [Perkinsus olseni]|uniref:Cathepsin propeptide inhibitor domain-containing protein n=1 Tax=Perkinsus olseni TaxID=32597 RepID=A0A7J6T5V2_PEROL|nr:hypothetical protein FOZ62_005198 [Perkinsus olseni]